MPNKLITSWTLGVFCFAGLASADPEPLPADSEILNLVEQISGDYLYASVDTLVGFHTRHTFSDTISDSLGIGAARTWVRGRFDQLGVPAALFPWTTTWGGSLYNCYNVHATLEGSSGQNGIIVLGAHLDSRTVSSNDTAGFAPGADDDGSGVAALLEIGRIFPATQFWTTVIPAVFAGEEQGLLGAEAYAESLQNSSTPVTAMINMDMIGHIVYPDSTVDSTTVRCYSGGPQSSSSRQLARYVKWVGEAYSEGLTIALIDALDRPGRGGDHIPFYERGYPAARLIETAEDPAYQHNPNDLPQYMSFSYVRKVARLAMGVAATLASTSTVQSEPTVLNAGDGQSLLVSWPDTLVPPPGGVIRIAYRELAQLYWEDIISTSDPPPLQIGGLIEGQQYEVSLSVSDENGRPSPFSNESSGVPIAAPPPEDFETTSTPTGVELRWEPRPEPNTMEYLIERSLPGGNFEPLATVPHPDSAWFDGDLGTGQLYLYRILTRNDQMVIGNPSPVQEGQLASHHLGILLVDATLDGGGAPGAPRDDEVDAFYDSVLAPYQVDGQWDRADSLAMDITLSDADLAPYVLAFIHADYNTATLSADTTAFRKYLSNGGRLLIVGWRLSYSIEGGMGYEHGFGPGDFLYDLARIDSIRVVPPPDIEFVGADGLLGYPDLAFDAIRFPYWGGELPFADAIWTETFPADVDSIAAFIAASGGASPYQGRPVALRGGAAEAAWILIDAPAFYMTAESATTFLRYALEDLNAPPVGIQESPSVRIPTEFELYIPYPNPFNPMTRFRLVLPQRSRVRLTVHDITGCRVRTLADGWFNAGSYDLVFEGTNLSSGVYVYRLLAGDYRASGKMVLLK